MRIFIVGGSGMLGHQLWRQLQPNHEVWVMLRRPPAEFARYGLFETGRVEIANVEDFSRVEEIVRAIRPAAVLNCVGIIKQLKEAKSPIPSLTINSLLPHKLADLCGECGARLIHFSTDCVFSGQKGDYVEQDIPDAQDLYGRTKLLGEVTAFPHAITLRTSIIGRELGTAYSLLDWFLSQNGGRVKGFQRAIYSGFTTLEMGRIVEQILVRHTDLAGLWHVASAPINKYDLLCIIKEKFGLSVEIAPSRDFVCDRSLDASRFCAAAGYQPPSWSSMIAELAELNQTLRF